MDIVWSVARAFLTRCCKWRTNGQWRSCLPGIEEEARIFRIFARFCFYVWRIEWIVHPQPGLAESWYNNFEGGTGNQKKVPQDSLLGPWHMTRSYTHLYLQLFAANATRTNWWYTRTPSLRTETSRTSLQRRMADWPPSWGSRPQTGGSIGLPEEEREEHKSYPPLRGANCSRLRYLDIHPDCGLTFRTRIKECPEGLALIIL